jgi:hypothetical protein
MLPRIVAASLRASAVQDLIYLNNPKAACSTIKANLWSRIAPQTARPGHNVHAIPGSPFATSLADGGWMAGTRIFTFVRNPLSRIVSAYLDKIVRRNDRNWEGFARKHRIDPAAEMPFDRFVRILARNCPSEFNGHWRPQHLNTMAGLIVPNFTGHVERFQTDFERVLARVFPGRPTTTERRDRHRTQAQQLTEDFFADRRTLGRFLGLCERDFALFGYGDDPARRQPLRPAAEWSDHAHPGLGALVRLRTGPEAARAAALEGGLAAGDDRFTADWLLAERLALVEDAPAARTELLAAHRDRIAEGHAFLRKRARRDRRGAAGLTGARGRLSRRCRQRCCRRPARRAGRS